MHPSLSDIEAETPETAALPQRGNRSVMQSFLDHTKCPASYGERFTCAPTSGQKGFFSFRDLRLYGEASDGCVSPTFTDRLRGVDSSITLTNDSVSLPFNPGEIIDNLRRERYVGAVNSEIGFVSNGQSVYRRAYYAVRPLLPVALRRILQQTALKDWAKIPFPSWPVDTTVEDFIGQLWLLALKSSGEERIPFIYYWPKGFQGCAIMTHDVETGEGQNFCLKMLEIEREYGIRSSFELVPEVRYEIAAKVLEAIRSAGSEVCVHGLNHDGRLFSSEPEFRRRAERINQYRRRWEASGFRSPIMYRNQSWYDAFEFSYDMSVPNVAHLDPQRGGCCTVFPFFIGDVLELPLTTIQDYTLYNILRLNPLELWARQMDTILARHGLVSFIIHPDYTIKAERQGLYRELLGLLKRYAMERKMWLALPGEVDRWWRQRDKMVLSHQDGKWVIQGEGSEQAAVAYATVEGKKLRFVMGD